MGIPTIRHIKDKNTYYQLFESGRFGNKTQAWDSALDALREGPDSGLYAIRSRTIRGFRTLYNLPKHLLACKAIENPVLPPKDQAISLMAPDSRIVWQGEFIRNEYGLQLLGSFERKPMKVALKNPFNWSGLRAQSLLNSTLWPSSKSDLEELEEDFPGHAIELSVYSCAVGDCPHRNTIIWEVRDY